MIRFVEIENFKSIGARARIELRPLSLLFGPNSSGKSSVIQALLYAREILVHHAYDVAHTEAGGSQVDLGGFFKFVHRRSSLNEVKLLFGLEPATDPHASFLPSELVDRAQGLRYFDVINRLRSSWVELEVSSESDVPKLQWRVGINGETLAHVGPWRGPGGSFRHAIYLHWDHPIFADGNGGSLLPAMYEAAGGTRESLGHGRGLPMPGLTEVLPPLDRPLSVHFGPPTQEDQFATRAVFSALLSELILAPTRTLVDQLRGLRYVGPLRALPPRHFDPGRPSRKDDWASGLSAWHVLARNPTVFKAVSEWIGREDLLNLGYQLRLEAFSEVTEDLRRRILAADETLHEETSELHNEVANLPSKTRIVLSDQHDLPLQVQDVGAGLAQVVPVVTATLDPDASVVGLEHPELHLHPRVQADVGDMLITGALCLGSKRLVIVETHSQHLLLRLLRRIRETTHRRLPPDRLPLQKEDLSVTYIDRTPLGAHAKLLRVDDEGEFLDEWPHGFFEEALDELLGG